MIVSFFRDRSVLHTQGSAVTENIRCPAGSRAVLLSPHHFASPDHVASHRISSAHATSCHSTSCHFAPHRVATHLPASRPTMSHSVTPHHVPPHHTRPHHTTPHHTAPNHTTQHLTTPKHTAGVCGRLSIGFAPIMVCIIVFAEIGRGGVPVHPPTGPCTQGIASFPISSFFRAGPMWMSPQQFSSSPNGPLVDAPP